MASVASGHALPSGCRIFTSIPDVFFIPEFLFGGSVGILVAMSGQSWYSPVGWVMFVSVFCFVVTTVWFFIFLGGANEKSIWLSLDVGYHFVAALFYLSVLVTLAFIDTVLASWIEHSHSGILILYRMGISAAVLSFMATLFYFFHAIFSAIRWKRSK
ncbi:myelin and lymphocyte protein-like [Micropterus salmoides]|uniref:myelin and lymphocyte protein-like n=1 Tax=Micropterus salmoides TaxID=27706 RepID=UPI0018EBEA3D|nr:myelin and lymphocyte protein-like [Micropterus salmoides]